MSEHQLQSCEATWCVGMTQPCSCTEQGFQILLWRLMDNKPEWETSIWYSLFLWTIHVSYWPLSSSVVYTQCSPYMHSRPLYGVRGHRPKVITWWACPARVCTPEIQRWIPKNSQKVTKDVLDTGGVLVQLHNYSSFSINNHRGCHLP